LKLNIFVKFASFFSIGLHIFSIKKTTYLEVANLGDKRSTTKKLVIMASVISSDISPLQPYSHKLEKNKYFKIFVNNVLSPGCCYQETISPNYESFLTVQMYLQTIIRHPRLAVSLITLANNISTRQPADSLVQDIPQAITTV